MRDPSILPGRALRGALLAAAVIVSGGSSPRVGADAATAPSLAVVRSDPGRSVRLSWNAQPNHRYRLESTGLVPGVWSTVVELLTGPAEGGPRGWTDTNALDNAGSRFFRLADLGEVSLGALGQEAAFRASDLVPVELGDLYTQSARNASDAIAFATSVVSPGGLPVTRGTVRLTGDITTPAVYEPQPGDRLVLVPLQGPRVEVFVQELDLARGVYQWRQTSDGSDLVFRSEPATQGTQIRVSGRYHSANFVGVSFEVDLTGVVSGFSEVDSSGNHTLSDMTVRGTVAAAGFTQTVNTRSRFEFVSVRGVSGKLQSSSTSENWNNNTVVWGGDTYVWNNVKRQRSFRDGKESELDTYWNATGTLTRNGAEFGVYRKQLTAVGTAVIDLRFQVVLADRVVDVEQWTVQVASP